MHMIIMIVLSENKLKRDTAFIREERRVGNLSYWMDHYSGDHKMVYSDCYLCIFNY